MFSMIKSEKELDDIIKNGGKVIVTKECFKNPIHGSFMPVFWSLVHFPSQSPCGAIIDNKHRIFDDFPTEKIPIISGKDCSITRSVQIYRSLQVK